MAAIHETRLSIRFVGDDLDPDEITTLLECPPSASTSKGAVIVSSKGKKRIARTGLWRLSASHRSPGDLDGQVAELLNKLSDDLFVWKDLALRFDGDAFCGVFMQESNEGISLSVETMQNLSARGLTIGFDIYDGSE